VTVSRLATRAPKHLQRSGKALWRQIVGDFELEGHHLVILQAACEALDRMTEAREAISADGLTYTDARGMIHAHPAVAIERDARIALLRALRELSLDSDVVESAARAPQIAGGRRYAPGR
jgi:P27 family predicted phage terminase small subunit